MELFNHPRQQGNILRMEVKATELDQLALCPFIEAIQETSHIEFIFFT